MIFELVSQFYVCLRKLMHCFLLSKFLNVKAIVGSWATPVGTISVETLLTIVASSTGHVASIQYPLIALWPLGINPAQRAQSYWDIIWIMLEIFGHKVIFIVGNKVRGVQLCAAEQRTPHTQLSRTHKLWSGARCHECHADVETWHWLGWTQQRPLASL